MIGVEDDKSVALLRMREGALMRMFPARRVVGMVVLRRKALVTHDERR